MAYNFCFNIYIKSDLLTDLQVWPQLIWLLVSALSKPSLKLSELSPKLARLRIDSPAYLVEQLRNSRGWGFSLTTVSGVERLGLRSRGTFLHDVSVSHLTQIHHSCSYPRPWIYLPHLCRPSSETNSWRMAGCSGRHPRLLQIRQPLN